MFCLKAAKAENEFPHGWPTHIGGSGSFKIYRLPCRARDTFIINARGYRMTGLAARSAPSDRTSFFMCTFHKL